MNKGIKQKILTLVKKDQKMRQENIRYYKIDKANKKVLKKIIDEYGWPDINLVGKKASQGAWLIAQHADHDPQFQEYCLKLIKIKLREGTVDPANYAYLKDRVLVNQGKMQLFGTQFYMNKNNKRIPRPIANKKELTKRRKKYNLISFTKYKKIMQNLPLPAKKIIEEI